MHGDAVLVIARGFGQVDLVGDAVDDIVIVGREVRVDERRILRSRLDLVENAGRHFEPVLHLLAGDCDRLDRVRIEIEIGDILDRDVAGRHIGEVIRTAATARLERGSSRQDGQVLVRPILQHGLDVPGLRDRDDLDRGIVCDQREIGIEWRGSRADRRAHIVERCLMFGRDRGDHVGLVLGIGDDLAVLVAVVDRPRLAGEVDDFPACAVLFQEQIDQAHMRAPEARHDGRLAQQRALDRIDPRYFLEILRAGKDEMLVAGEDRVDAFDAGEIERGVFHALALAMAIDAGMRKRDDDVGAFLAHLRHPGACRLQDVARLRAAFEVLRIPQHDLRGHEADEADLDRAGGARAVTDLFLEDHVGLEVECILLRIGGEFALGQIGANKGKLRAGQRVEHEVQAVVELVIAERAAIIAEHVHRLDHRMQVARLHALLIGHVVAHRIALQEVAIVDQHGIAGFRADGINQACGARQSHRVVRLVGVVIVRHHVDMDIGRFHQPQMRLIGRGARGKRMKRDECCRGGDAAEERAAGNRMEIEERRHGGLTKNWI